MIAQNHHLDDERLLECYTAERFGEPIEPPLAEHMVDCGNCAARFDELARFMDGLREDADAEIDLIFSPDRLRAQQAEIAARIERTGRVARIISFPGRLMSRSIGSQPRRIVPRWTASAAAAGLFVGVALGMFVDQQDSEPVAQPARTAGPVTVSTPAAAAVPAPAATSEYSYGAFLLELDQARGGPRSPELWPFDAMTPHVHEISAQLR